MFTRKHEDTATKGPRRALRTLVALGLSAAAVTAAASPGHATVYTYGWGKGTTTIKCATYLHQAHFNVQVNSYGIEYGAQPVSAKIDVYQYNSTTRTFVYGGTTNWYNASGSLTLDQWGSVARGYFKYKVSYAWYYGGAWNIQSEWITTYLQVSSQYDYYGYPNPNGYCTL